MPSLAGASVVVLGATGGLGAPIARLAAERGAMVALVGRDAGRLAALGLPGLQIPADLRLPDAASAVLDAVMAEHGKVDVVVNATGVVAFGPVDALEVDVLEELFLTNTFIPVFVAKAALERLMRWRDDRQHLGRDRRAEPSRHGGLRGLQGRPPFLRRSCQPRSTTKQGASPRRQAWPHRDRARHTSDRR